MAAKQGCKILVSVLSAIIFGIGYLTYQNHADYIELRTAFEVEKKDLEDNITKVIRDYDLLVSENKEISEVLKIERAQMLSLKDSIESLEGKNYILFSRFRNKISLLSAQNKTLSQNIASLNEENGSLRAKTKIVVEQLTNSKNKFSKLSENNTTLQEKNRYLKKQLDKAKELEIDDLEIISMKKRYNGKYTTTSRRRKAAAFKISMNILANEVANAGQREIYIQIIDENKKVISKKKTTILTNGQKIDCTDALIANYQNNKITLVTLVEFPKGSLQKGNYLINVFIEGRFVGNRIVTLS